MPRIALGIEYNGSTYQGWQKQNSTPSTVQENLEHALSFVADHPVEVICAGRTDAGVHGMGQVVHFDTTVERKLDAWILGVNSRLPPTIRVRFAQIMSELFHARFSALSRQYYYVIDNSAVASAILDKQVTWHYHALDEVKMVEGAQYLLGELDFTSFRSSACQSKTPMRCVMHLKVNRHKNFIIIDIKANAFLHHMVRNIIGVLLEVGEGKRKPHWVKEVLLAKDRKQASITAPPDGLYLMKVEYPAEFQVPLFANSFFIPPL